MSTTIELSASVALAQRTPSHWRVTLDNPPINLFDNEMKRGLQSLIGLLERDEFVTVVVFESANPEFFLAHLDLNGDVDLTKGPTGLGPWPDFAKRLETGPFVSVGVLRGRARGVGSEFMQALDVRFASRERAILSQIEVGCSLIPGGGGLERLHRLIGRSRAMEVITASQDFDAATAELYGWVNRSIPDDELDAFVDRYVERVAGFEKSAIAAAKSVLNERAGLATVADLDATQKTFFTMLQSPVAKERIKALFDRGLQEHGELELRLGSLIA